jgi:Sortase domain
MATRARRRGPAALAGLVLILTLGGCAERLPWPAGPGARTPASGPAQPATAPPAPAPTGDPAGPRPGIDAPAVPPRAPGFEVGELPGQVTVPGPASPPVGLAIPAIGVATRLVRLGLEPDGAMAVPEDFGRAGWFAEGPAPGQVGPAVIAGHVDSGRGPAVFYRLRDLRPGDAVLVERADGTRLRFLVEQARSYPKARFPTAAVFGPATAAVLRLVTCTGAFDRVRASYRDNLVVFARLAGVTR